MRAVAQRVASVRLAADGVPHSEIGAGLLVYLGVGRDDAALDAEWMADKIAGLRVFKDDDGRMNLSVLDLGLEVMIVSQFTLYGDARKGKRPSYDNAAPPERARELYELVASLVRARGISTAMGKFQASMLIESAVDGPVTILLDSKKAF
jgi:D-tyrosyl-tRNA(Tyr) deacylase